MSVDLSLPMGWERVEHPPSLFRRYEFGSYRETRAFLDRLAALSTETGLFPDLGFGSTYVNVTLRGDTLLSNAEHEFANRVGELCSTGPAAG